jgi:hypothetical protein
MSNAIETVRLALEWLRGEPLIAVAVVALIVGPGAMLCWFAYHVTAIRMAPGAIHPARFRRRPGPLDRIEQRLANLCHALSLLTDSTESGLRATIAGLERLSGPTPAPAAAAIDTPVTPAGASDPILARVAEGRTPREIAIAEGVSEGEVRLRLRLGNA